MASMTSLVDAVARLTKQPRVPSAEPRAYAQGEPSGRFVKKGTTTGPTIGKHVRLKGRTA